MKSLVYAATLTSALIFSVTSTQASETSMNPQIPYLTGSLASPLNSRAPFPRYRIGLNSAGYSLSQLTLDLPKGISIKRVSITDKSGQKIKSNTSQHDRKLLINFPQPVAPKTDLVISLNSVRTSTRNGRVWLFPISGREAAMATDIPLGTARIHTYSN